MNENIIEIHPIGEVIIDKNGYLLKIKSEYISGLTEIEGFSYLQVFWWCHYNDNQSARSTLNCKTPYKAAPDNIGVFATRSPHRPNPIALTAVKVLVVDHENGIIRVAYIDAENGTPIIDIKPYHPSCDRIRNVSVPDWCSSWPQWYEDSATFDWGSVFRF
ncbi:MAG: tRNA (N6-threonylcarbamoyladenosine(37)-N6)-methyltransferase TrmO [Candidatus Stygibacter australis]|nr:tRNA (N6-threonylcarbamoyladenosine(37)-N6)-methyltransferase TrmO [Candidatus Stygibacter australis]MDP8323396.1 tRNA (N6-threonylcarbamoyladenosine(37)-N6)-methyltransferase TrmO [Candidatus Stygibacter australis]